MKKKTCISLIVLVITIIVMIILAASVMITISNTGIIDKASTAKDNMESAMLKQELEMALAFQAGNMGDLSETLKDVEGIQNTAVKKVEADGTEVVMTDMTYISRGNTTYTIYNGKELVEGKIEVWNKKVNSKQPASTSEGTKVMHLYSAEELKWIADQVNAGTNTFEGWTIYLESDVDFGARPDGDNWETATNENRKWEPIGINGTNKLEAVFDGKGHSVRGMYVNKTGNFGGLFGNCYSVKNLTIKDSYVKAAVCAAAVIGSSRPLNTSNAVIENCHSVNTIVIATDSRAAGVVAQLVEGDTVTKCSNSGAITSKGNFVGGVVALALGNAKVIESSNTGVIVGETNAAGGVVGGANDYVTIANNTNAGTVSCAAYYASGIIGYGTKNITITNNANTGKITASQYYAAGIIGCTADGSTVSNNINSGAILSEGILAGGIVGQVNYNSSVLNNINNGTVTTKSYGAGGIIATLETSEGLSKISGNVNNGAVQGEQKWVGGILAICNTSQNVISLEVSNNINNGNVGTEKGAFRVAGIIGNCNGATVVFNNINRGNIDGYGNMTAAESYGAGGIVGTKGGRVYIYNCFNSGNVKSKNFAGGIVGNSYPVGEDGNDVLSDYDGEYIKGVYNTGSVEAVGGYAGGIFGAYDVRENTEPELKKQVTNAYNMGEVRGLNSAGLVGSLAGVKNSINMGAVTGTNKYGVIANKLATTEISNVYYLSGVPSDVGTAMDKASMTNSFMQGVLGTELFNYSSSTPQLYKINVEYTKDGITNVTVTNEILK